jgi:hypothetical protein
MDGKKENKLESGESKGANGDYRDQLHSLKISVQDTIDLY